MRFRPPTTSLGLAAAFVGGLVVSPLARHPIPAARGQSPAPAVPAVLAPAMIDLSALQYDDLPATPFPDLHARTFVASDHATVALQSGNIAKHFHAGNDEIQFIIEGSGAMWLGSERKAFKPGTLIIIPKGVPHAGTVVASGPVKALVVKLPPQGKTDIAFVD